MSAPAAGAVDAVFVALADPTRRQLLEYPRKKPSLICNNEIDNPQKT